MKEDKRDGGRGRQTGGEGLEGGEEVRSDR